MTPILARTVEDVVMPLSQPIRGLDGKLLSEIYVPRGTFILTGNWTSNVNKTLWGDDAYEWKPERWLVPAPEALKEAKERVERLESTRVNLDRILTAVNGVMGIVEPLGEVST